jgi:prepilin-type N-terminal cleavage/methylation domain-containing protein
MDAMREHRTDGERGFSLVEALVTLVIFGIGTVALLQLAPRATQFSNRGRLLSEATNLAQAKVEELRALPTTDADLAAGVHVDPESPIEDRFERRWEVIENDPIEGMRRVEMRVRFPTQSADSVAVVVTYF